MERQSVYRIVLIDDSQMARLGLRDELGRICLLYTSDAADERSSVDLGGRRIIKKKKKIETREPQSIIRTQEDK